MESPVDEDVPVDLRLGATTATLPGAAKKEVLRVTESGVERKAFVVHKNNSKATIAGTTTSLLMDFMVL